MKFTSVLIRINCTVNHSLCNTWRQYTRHFSSNNSIQAKNKRLDVVILGATGFTGEYVTKEFIKIGHKKHSWGIAGRNTQKLTKLLETLTTKSGQDITKIPVIVADCEDKKSLDSMAKQAKVVINCCGPYRFYGESVVNACVENGASYIDVSGEPEYMEKIQLLYNYDAEQNGVYIVSACGMDNVPVDMGVIFLYHNFNGILNTVESYMQLSSTNKTYMPICNFTTWESAVHGFTNQTNLITIRKKLNSKFKRHNLQPKLSRRPNIHRTDLFDDKQCIAFPGSDRSVVNRSQALLAEFYNQRPVQFNPFLVCDDLVVLFAVKTSVYFLQSLTKYAVGRKLLLKYPEFFTLGMMSRKGVPEDAAIRTKLVFRFRGEGWSSGTDLNTPPNKTVIAEFSCQNPVYGFTSTSAILCALTIITEADKLPRRGGVFTPGVAFAKTSLIEHLNKHGATFKVLDEKTK